MSSVVNIKEKRTGSVISTALSMSTSPLFFQTFSIMSIVMRTASSQTSLLLGYTSFRVSQALSRFITNGPNGTSEKAGFAIFRCFFHSSPSVVTIFRPKRLIALYCSVGFGQRTLHEVISWKIRLSGARIFHKVRRFFLAFATSASAIQNMRRARGHRDTWRRRGEDLKTIVMWLGQWRLDIRGRWYLTYISWNLDE